MHYVLLPAFMAIALIAFAAGGLAQTAPTGVLPATPNPAECGINPREDAQLAVATPGLPPIASPAASRTGGSQQADPATTAFAASVLRETIACGNAHGFAGAASLVSDAALARDVLGTGAEVLGFAAGEPAPKADARRALVAVVEVRDLGDGRLTVTAEIANPSRAPATEIVRVVLAEDAAGTGGSEQYLYLIDGLEPAASVTPPLPSTPAA